MLTFAPPSGVWLLSQPTDMRKSFDDLMALVEQHCQRNVLDGGLFLFVNKRREHRVRSQKQHAEAQRRVAGA